MSTVNINRTNTQSDKSNNVNPMLHTNPDYRGIGLLIGMIIVSLIAVWIIALLVAWLIGRNDYDSHLAFNVFIGGLIVFGLALVIGIIASLPILLQVIQNMQYRFFNGVLMHREDIRRLSDQLIAVALENAKSTATTGAETYSPSIHTTNNKTDNNNMTSAENAKTLEDLLFNTNALDKI